MLAAVAWPAMWPLRCTAAIVALSFAATSCVVDNIGDAEPTMSPPPTDQAAPSCPVGQAGNEPIATGSVAGDVLELSREMFTCADDVVVADGSDIHAIAAAAQLAAAMHAPLLLPHPELAAELDRLEPADVYVVGDVDVAAVAGPDVQRITAGDAAQLAADALQVSLDPSQPSHVDAASFVTTLQAMDGRDRVAVPETSQTPENSPSTEAADTAQAPADIDLGTVIAGLPAPTESQPVWLVEAGDPMAILAVSPAAATAGAAIVPVDGSDLFRFPQVGDLLSGRSVQQIRRIGSIPEDADWELRVLAGGQQLPGGGYELFPDDMMRRFVAYYGHPDSSGLGILGHHDGPEAALAHMRPLLDGYAEGSDVVVPTFNVIATVAHNGGATGRPDGQIALDSPRYVDYSTMHPPERFREWVDVTAEANGYFVMDFQPGRNDFLFQVQHYEDLLRLPHVGVALDPEWRLGPGEEHLQQIGSVTAAEINTVINYLADLVRDEGLPQKLVMIHQFRLDMIQDREKIVDREEVAVVIQMDGEGQGGLSVKDDTYRAITAGAEDAHWQWGWKNFVERDTPRPNTPAETMGKEPSPVYVSYQ